MNTNEPVLGKGLGSLIPNILGGENSWGPTVQTIQGEQIVKVSVDLIDSNPWQPRKSFDREKLEELANSIKEHGIVQPLIVTSAENGRYQLVAGERRLKAARLIGFTEVPVVIRKLEEQKKMEVSLIENIQRHNLNPLEEALSYKRLMDEFNLTQEEVSQRVGKSRSTVANFLRILALPKPALEALQAEHISFSHAKAILSYASEKERLQALKRILREGLTVAQASRPIARREGAQMPQDPVLAAWEDKLSSRLGFRARIRKQRRGGIIEISFQSEEDLKTLLESLLNPKL